MKKKRYRRKKRGPVQAKKVTYDGIKFASGLEKYMYQAIKKAKLKAWAQIKQNEDVQKLINEENEYKKRKLNSSLETIEAMINMPK